MSKMLFTTHYGEPEHDHGTFSVSMPCKIDGEFAAYAEKRAEEIRAKDPLRALEKLSDDVAVKVVAAMAEGNVGEQA